MSKVTAIEHLDINSILTPNRKYRGYETHNDTQETPLPSKSTAPNTTIKHSGYDDEADFEERHFNPDTFLAD